MCVSPDNVSDLSFTTKTEDQDVDENAEVEKEN